MSPSTSRTRSAVIGPSPNEPTWSSSDSASRIPRSEEHTSELQSQSNLVCRLLLEKKNNTTTKAKTLQTPTPAHVRRRHRRSAGSTAYREGTTCQPPTLLHRRPPIVASQHAAKVAP